MLPECVCMLARLPRYLAPETWGCVYACLHLCTPGDACHNTMQGVRPQSLLHYWLSLLHHCLWGGRGQRFSPVLWLFRGRGWGGAGQGIRLRDGGTLSDMTGDGDRDRDRERDRD